MEGETAAWAAGWPTSREERETERGGRQKGNLRERGKQRRWDREREKEEELEGEGERGRENEVET